jgi:2-oxoglutarate dehydrogenase E1 component
VIWEAQFGDFVNVAQVLIDQFIASAEEKWRRLSGVVMLLPHGMEGQGPEHSSARLERFLTMAAEENMQIVSPSTPAQFFHCLRRQVLRKWRKPLVIFSHKSLLRHPQVVSSLDEFERGRFQRVLPDTQPAEKVERVLLCNGRIYYDLQEMREENARTDVALVRIEQLYPFPHAQLRAALEPYPEGTPVYWVQDEPENMGAWRYLRCMFGAELFELYPFGGFMRPAAASPATGSHSSHELEQNHLLAQAFGKTE